MTRYRHRPVDGRQVHVTGSRPRSPGWQAFLRNHTAHIARIDLFVVPTIGFNLLYRLVILRLERRRLVWTDVTANPTAEWIAQQISEAFPWDEAPRYLVRDRDTSYGASVSVDSEPSATSWPSQRTSHCDSPPIWRTERSYRPRAAHSNGKEPCPYAVNQRASVMAAMR